MNSIIPRCHNHPSALQHPAPIADGFALRWIDAVSGPMRHRAIRPISSNIRRLTDATIRLIGVSATPSSSATLQIPIAR
jgi:hypothetical protein